MALNHYDAPNEAADRARLVAQNELQVVLKELKEARRVLRRDWDQLAPRERSARSRIVKDLEQRQTSLEDEIEMNNCA